MESISTPQVINMPFCANGDKNTIPSAATGTQRASLEEGFPEITSKPISEGGIPPEREDFNGAANLNSQFYFAFQNGWWPTFDAEVSTAIGGYPIGAVLWWFPTTGEYANMAVPLKSLVANNTYNFNTNTSYIGVYWKPLYKQPSAMPIGTVFGHQSSNAADVPGGLPLFTGETISSANTMYPDFYNWVLSHTELQISAADYESAITTYGECPKYVIDDTNKTIRLPKLANYIKMANTTDGVTQAAAGLPNITGSMEAKIAGGSSIGAILQNGTGALKTSTNGTVSGASMGSSYGKAVIELDASDSNPIYGNSDTNTPAHTTLFPWVCAYNAVVPASTAQAAEFQNALSSKADVDLSNLTQKSTFNVLKPQNTLMYVNSAGVIATIGGRSFYKANADGGYAAIYQTDSNYIQPVIVAETAAGAMGYDDVNTTPRYIGTFSWNGKTWYYSASGYAMLSSSSITSSLPLLRGTHSGEGGGALNAAQALLDLQFSTPKNTLPVETYRNGASWYRVYSDGWCEQGGAATLGTSSYTFLKSYQSPPQVFFQGVTDNVAAATNAGAWVINSMPTTTGFTIISTFNSTYFLGGFWEAKGYIF